MRRMRENYLQIFLFVISVGVMGSGISYFMKKRNTASTSDEKILEMEQPQQQDRAKSKQLSSTEKNSGDEEDLLSSATEPNAEPSLLPVEKKNRESGGESKSNELSLLVERYESPSYLKGSHDPGTCRRVEFRGNGFQRTHVSNAEWKKVLDQFHEAKKLLQAWLVKNRDKFSDKTAMFMESQVQKLRIARPPSNDEPDLSWRGIGIWTRDEKDALTIRLGSGFVKQVLEESQRALFEMTRLVAQSWAPCELGRLDTKNSWEPLLNCLEIHEEQSCASGTYSEAGWAVSSSLAAGLANPGCTLPVFKDRRKALCLQNHILSPLLVKDRMPATHRKVHHE